MAELENLKTKLVEACRTRLMETIRHLKAAVDEIQQSANEYGAPKDRYDSYRTQLLRKRDMMARQLQQAQDQFVALEKIDPEKTFLTPAFGALVVTDQQKLFISVGLGKIEIQGETWYAVSPVVPVAKALQGKKAGEELIFNGRKFKILQVL